VLKLEELRRFRAVNKGVSKLAIAIRYSGQLVSFPTIIFVLFLLVQSIARLKQIEGKLKFAECSHFIAIYLLKFKREKGY
jgi:hypothetical protein